MSVYPKPPPLLSSVVPGWPAQNPGTRRRILPYGVPRTDPSAYMRSHKARLLAGRDKAGRGAGGTYLGAERLPGSGSAAGRGALVVAAPTAGSQGVAAGGHRRRRRRGARQAGAVTGRERRGGRAGPAAAGRVAAARGRERRDCGAAEGGQ